MTEVFDLLLIELSIQFETHRDGCPYGNRLIVLPSRRENPLHDRIDGRLIEYCRVALHDPRLSYLAVFADAHIHPHMFMSVIQG
jgi:hypothetical protein